MCLTATSLGQPKDVRDSPKNVCAVCDVMEICVSDCIRISEKTRHTRFRLGARKTPVRLRTDFDYVMFTSGL